MSRLSRDRVAILKGLKTQWLWRQHTGHSAQYGQPKGFKPCIGKCKVTIQADIPLPLLVTTEKDVTALIARQLHLYANTGLKHLTWQLCGHRSGASTKLACSSSVFTWTKGWTTHVGSFIAAGQADVALSTIESAGSTLRVAHLVCQALWHGLGRQGHWVQGVASAQQPVHRQTGS